MTLQTFLVDLLNVAVQASVPLVAIALIFLLKKAHAYLTVLKEKDKLHIIDFLTDRAAALAHAELDGGKAEDIFSKALSYASTFLTEHGITVSADRLRADVQDGINKLPYNITSELQSYLPFLNNGVADQPASIQPIHPVVDDMIISDPVAITPPAPVVEPIADPVAPVPDVAPTVSVAETPTSPPDPIDPSIQK